MGAKVAAGIIGLLFLASLILVGVFCAAFAIDQAFATLVSTAWAAAITALILLFVPLFALLIILLRRPKESPLMQFVTALSHSSPVVAVLGAGAIGIVESLLKKKRRRPRDDD
ncbi:MAG TPA: hypothetical protein VG867_10125 [Rhizomicrobium sp.]|nr:hypothetical protein [Rhizomicrobium sp.]